MHRDENYHRTLTIPRPSCVDARPAPGSPASAWTCAEYRGQDALPLAETMRELTRRAQEERVAARQQAWIDAALGTGDVDLLVIRDAWDAAVSAFQIALLPEQMLLVRELAVTGGETTRRRIAAVVLRKVSEHLHADHARALVVRGACVETMLDHLGWRTTGYAGDGHHVWVPATTA